MSGKVLSWRLIDSTGCLGVVVGIHSVLRSVRGAAFRLNRTIVSVLRFSSCLASLIALVIRAVRSTEAVAVLISFVATQMFS